MLLRMTPTPPSWTAYLPPTLQLPQFYFSVLVLFAIVGTAKQIPGSARQPWIVQTITLSIAIPLFGSIMGFGVYAFGTAAIGAWGATSLYDMFYNLLFKFIENKLYAIFGATPPSDSSPQMIGQDEISKLPNSQKNP